MISVLFIASPGLFLYATCGTLPKVPGYASLPACGRGERRIDARPGGFSFLAQKFGQVFQFCFPPCEIPLFVRLYRRSKEGALWPTSCDICYGRPENVFRES